MCVILSKFIFAPQNYTIDGDKVYIDDSNVYIEARPHTIRGSKFVNFTLISKNYEGNVNILFGFDQFTRTSTADLFMPNGVNHTMQYTCTGNIATWFNYTINPKHAWCWENITDEVTGDYSKDQFYLTFNHSFESANLATKTVYWTEKDYWLDIKNQFKSFDYSYDNKTKWYYLDSVSILKDKEYVLRSYIDVPNIEGYFSKYSVAVYPSIYGTNIQQAITDGKFYYLDPWVNGKYTTGGALIAWNDDTTQVIQSRTYNNTNFSREKNAKTTSHTAKMLRPFIVEVASSPRIGSNESIVMIVSNGSNNSRVSAQVWNGSNWTNRKLFQNKTVNGTGALTGNTIWRSIDVGYINTTHAMLVMWANESVDKSISVYRLWNSKTKTWGDENFLPDATKLYKPVQQELGCDLYGTSNYCVLVQCANSTFSKVSPAYAQIWNGSEWDYRNGKNITLLNGTVGRNCADNFHGIDVEYDRNGNAMVVYIQKTAPVSVYYRYWNNSLKAWENNKTIFNKGGVAFQYIELAYNPNATLKKSRYAIVTNQAGIISAAIYNGTNWTKRKNVSATGLTNFYSVDVAYTQHGDAVVVFVDATKLTTGYRIFNGTNWSTKRFAKDRIATPRLVRVASDPTPYSDYLVLMDEDSANDVFVQMWNGTNWSKNKLLDANARFLTPGFGVAFYRQNIIPKVTLISPANGISTENVSEIFNCSATNDVTLTGMSLEIWNTTHSYFSNKTTCIGRTCFFKKNIIMSSDSYTWNCNATTINRISKWSVINYTYTKTGVADTCTAPGSGDWSITCSDNCVWSTPQSVPANMKITGSGRLRLSSIITFTGSGQYISMMSGCRLEIISGGKIQG